MLWGQENCTVGGEEHKRVKPYQLPVSTQPFCLSVTFSTHHKLHPTTEDTQLFLQEWDREKERERERQDKQKLLRTHKPHLKSAVPCDETELPLSFQHKCHSIASPSLAMCPYKSCWQLFGCSEMQKALQLKAWDSKSSHCAGEIHTPPELSAKATVFHFLANTTQSHKHAGHDGSGGITDIGPEGERGKEDRERKRERGRVWWMMHF